VVISDHPSPGREDHPHREALLPSPYAITSQRFLVGEDDAGSDYLFHLFNFEFDVGFFGHGLFSLQWMIRVIEPEQASSFDEAGATLN
jgi:hypothetical protein